ncbi:MAG: MoaD/ThiS family protein [Desulfatiglandaceae bacterium]
MRVQIRLFSNLRQYAPGDGGTFQSELGVGATVHRLMEELEIPSSVKRVILVNGYHGKEDTVLTDGDTVTLFPPMAGG